MRCSGSPMHLLRPILGAAAAVLLAPQAAQAATLDPLGPCYRSVGEAPETREAVAVRGQGFTPGEPVTISVDGRVVEEDAFADAFGNVIGDVRAPYRAK